MSDLNNLNNSKAFTVPKNGLRFFSTLFRSDLYQHKEIIDLYIDNFQIKNYYYFHHSFIPQAEYYSKEMGKQGSLKKLFVIDLDSFDREDLYKQKLIAVDIENKNSDNGRKINIDPGLITLENVLLSSGKNYAHRVYIRDGVFYELELIFKANKCEELPWTYPDYKDEKIKELFILARQSLL